MYPTCLIADIFFMYREIKSIHFRTINRERAEMLADRYLECGSVWSPAHIAEKENIFFPSKFDLSRLAIKLVALPELFDSRSEIEAAAAGCQGHFVLQLRRQKRRPWQVFGDPHWYIGISLHQGASPQQVLASVLAASALRRQLLRQPCVGLQGASLKCGGPGEDWWLDSTGKVSSQVQQCTWRMVRFGIRHVQEMTELLMGYGWLCSVFALSRVERVRFSVMCPRSIGGVRWVTFR
jgi:hypothetical protein